MHHRHRCAFNASLIINDVMTVGSAKDGDDASWASKPQDYHLDRAVRHIQTHKLIRNRHQKPDGEEHLKLALTRLAMALFCN